MLHLGYFLLLQMGYRKGDLSLVYPTARAIGPLLSTTFAVLFLGETLSAQIALGGAIIIFGVLMLTGGVKRGSGQGALSLGFGVGAGLLIGSYTAWDAYAVSVLLIPPLLIDYVSSVGRSVLLAPIAYRRRRQVHTIWEDHKLGVVAVAVFNPLAYILVLVALTFTPVVYVAPIRELSVFVDSADGECPATRRSPEAQTVLGGDHPDGGGYPGDFRLTTIPLFSCRNGRPALDRSASKAESRAVSSAGQLHPGYQASKRDHRACVRSCRQF